MNQSVLTPEQRAAYDRDGFVMVRGLFDPEEALLLQKAMETDPQVRNNPYIEHHHPFYTPLEKVPDSAIKAAGLKYGSGAEESFLKTFVNPPELKKTMQA